MALGPVLSSCPSIPASHRGSYTRTALSAGRASSPDEIDKRETPWDASEGSRCQLSEGTFLSSLGARSRGHCGVGGKDGLGESGSGRVEALAEK